MTNSNPDARFTVITLRTAAALFRHRAFIEAFYSNSTRFAWATRPVFDKLRTGIQLYSMARRFTELGSLRTDWDAVAEVFDQAATAAALRHGIQELTRQETACCLSVGDFFRNVETSRLVRDMQHGSDVADLLFRLEIHFQSVLTLQVSTGHPIFEKTLAGVQTEWILSGYPDDLLSSDARLIRAGEPVVRHLLNTDYCSTHMDIEGERPVRVSSSYQVVKYPQKPARLAA